MIAMPCHICGQEAVERCFTCGKLFCAQHGQVNCQRCQTAIAPGDRRADRVSAEPMADRQGPAWWRPQLAEDYEPPACYVCQGLARKTCRNCERLFCGEHAGPAGLCRECGRSSQLSLLILIGILGLMAAMILRGLWN